jgi:hypothetical protein
MRTSAGEKRFLRCTNADPTRSGGRQPAVVRIRVCNADRFLRTDYVSPRAVVSRTTAGLRQPLLVHARKSSQMGGGALQRRFVSHGGLTPPALVLQCERPPAKKRYLRCTNAHPTRSGGRQPAVVRQTRLRRHQGDCSQDRRQYVGRTPLHLRAAIPRGAYAPRSCAAMRTSAGERRFFRCTNAHPTKSGERQPAVGSIVPRKQCTANNVGE